MTEGVPQECQPLTPDEARTVGLPSVFHLSSRLGLLAAYGSEYPTHQVGDSPFPHFLTRGDLVRAAEAYERAQQDLARATGGVVPEGGAAVTEL